MKRKLTLVSVMFRNQLHSIYVMAEYDAQGKAHVNLELINAITDKMGAQRGNTFSIG